MWLSHRIHRRFKFTVVKVKDWCYLASSWIYTMKEELFSTYFTEGTTRMIGIILCFNSWISNYCLQYRSDFQHYGSFSVLEQHLFFCSVQFSSVAQSCLTLCNPMNRSMPGLCPSPTPRVYPNSCPLSQWCHLSISSSVIPFSSCLQSFPTSGAFKMSQLFASGGQNIGVSASISVLPMNTQNWFPLGWTGWISLPSKGL